MTDGSRGRSLLRGWLIYFFAVAAGAGVISLRYLLTTDPPDGSAAAVFRVLLFASHSLTMSALALAPLLLVIALRPSRTTVLICATGLGAALWCVLLMDTQIYNLYRFHLNAGVMNLLFGGAASETFIFSRQMYAQAALMMAVVVLCAWIAARVSFHASERQRAITGRTRWALAALVATIPAYHAWHIYADIVASEPILRQPSALPFPYSATARSSLAKLGVVGKDRSSGLQPSGAETGLAYPLEKLSCQEDNEHPNVIVIAIDSWRFDALSAKVTPNINEFAKRSVRFLQHYSGGNATRMGIFSLFYGIPGTYWHRMLAEQKRPVLMDALLEQSYSINVFRSAPLTSPEFDRTVFANIPDLRTRSKGDGPAEWDRDLTTDFKAFLRKRDRAQPFFAFLFYDAPHAFDLPKGYQSTLGPIANQVNYLELSRQSDPAPYRNRYLSSVNYDDSLVGEALDEIEQQGLLQNSIVIITGDHGQEFNDSGQGYWGHNGNYTRYQIGVPMLIFAPHQSPGEVQYRTSHFDVAPTIMSRYLGCNTPIDRYSVGRSLFEPEGRDQLLMSSYSEFAIVQPDQVTVVTSRGLERWTADYRSRLDSSVNLDVVSNALEQRSRFFKNVRLSAN